MLEGGGGGGEVGAQLPSLLSSSLDLEETKKTWTRPWSWWCARNLRGCRRLLAIAAATVVVVGGVLECVDIVVHSSKSSQTLPRQLNCTSQPVFNVSAACERSVFGMREVQRKGGADGYPPSPLMHDDPDIYVGSVFDVSVYSNVLRHLSLSEGAEFDYR